MHLQLYNEKVWMFLPSKGGPSFLHSALSWTMFQGSLEFSCTLKFWSRDSITIVCFLPSFHVKNLRKLAKYCPNVLLLLFDLIYNGFMSLNYYCEFLLYCPTPQHSMSLFCYPFFFFFSFFPALSHENMPLVSAPPFSQTPTNQFKEHNCDFQSKINRGVTSSFSLV